MSIDIAHDSRSIASVETHLVASRRNTYMVCEDMGLLWDLSQVQEFDHMWQEGLSVEDIAKAFGREVDEVAVLVIDRASKGKIERRRGGAFGCRFPEWVKSAE